MRTPKERLTHLLRLAAEGGGSRPQLVQELSEILIDWPREYAPTARTPFEALLDKAIRETDAQTREAVADMVTRRSDAPTGLLNQLFFGANAETKARIIARNDGTPERTTGPADFDEETLIDAARHAGEAFLPGLARGTGLSRDIAGEVLRDDSGYSLAIVCKGAHASRTTFSAIATLTDRSSTIDNSYARLGCYDAVPAGAAERMLAYWRTQDWAARNGSRNAAE